MNDLKFVSNKEGESVIITITGDIDAYHSAKLKEEMSNYIKTDESSIILDLSNVPYIDSAGLGTLVSILRETRNIKKSLKLIGLRPNIKRIFEMTRLDKIFAIFDTIEESAE